MKISIYVGEIRKILIYVGEIRKNINICICWRNKKYQYMYMLEK